MGDHIHLLVFLHLHKAGGLPRRFGMHVEIAECRRHTLRRHVHGFRGKRAQAPHLGCIEKLAIAGPAFDPVRRPHFVPAPPLSDDLQLVAVVNACNGGRFRVDFLVQVQRCRTGIGVANYGCSLRSGVTSGDSAKNTESRDNQKRPGNWHGKSAHRQTRCPVVSLAQLRRRGATPDDGPDIACQHRQYLRFQLLHGERLDEQ